MKIAVTLTVAAELEVDDAEVANLDMLDAAFEAAQGALPSGWSLEICQIDEVLP